MNNNNSNSNNNTGEFTQCCPVDKIHRNQCRYCRLQKCLKANMNKDGKFHNLIEFYFLPSKLWLEVLTLIGIIELISLYFKMSIKLYWMDIIGKFDMRCPPLQPPLPPPSFPDFRGRQHNRNNITTANVRQIDTVSVELLFLANRKSLSTREKY